MTFPPVPGADWFRRSMKLQASTGAAGYALVNGTGTIISWTAPDDGQLHRATVYHLLAVSLTETGGLVNVTYTGPQAGATLHTTAIIAAGQAASTAGTYGGVNLELIIGPGTTISIVQGSALTAGAATLYAEIWGS